MDLVHSLLMMIRTGIGHEEPARPRRHPPAAQAWQDGTCCAVVRNGNDPSWTILEPACIPLNFTGLNSEKSGMDEVGIAITQLAGIRKGVQAAIDTNYHRFQATAVATWFIRFNRHMASLRQQLPQLFEDIADIPTEPEVEDLNGELTGEFHKLQLQQLARTIDEVFEIRASSGLMTAMPEAKAQPRKVFISHGRAEDWRAVQAYIEKDIGLLTMELAQEPSGGATVIEKLESGAGRCDSAVIVMTGDDADSEGQARARENVLHEIGYFHGRYGRSRVILLHEVGVSVPSNLSGIVYVGFPKGLVSAAEGALARELRAIYGSK